AVLGISSGTNESGHCNVPARRYLQIASPCSGGPINHRRQRTGGLHFDYERSGVCRGFWRRRPARKREVEPRGQLERATARVSAFGGTDPDSSSIKTHRAVQARLSGQSTCKRQPAELRKATVFG